MAIKYTIEDLQEYAHSKGGKCLSTEYKYNESAYDWECSKGHKFTKLWLTIKCRGSWCRYCKSGDGIDVLQNFAEQNKGKLITEKFSGNDADYEWECENKHRWTNTWRHVQNNKTWCKECRKINVLKEMQEWAEKEGGKCLSTEFTKIKDIYNWECVNGHQWESSWVHIKWNGAWCQKCRCWTLENLQLLAESRGEKCLSHVEGTPNFGAGRYMWQCKKGHIFECQGSNLIYKSMCVQCNKLSLDQAQELAKIKGGECLSETYVNKRTHLLWKCDKKHIWKAKIHSIKKGSWCKECYLNDAIHWKIEDIQNFVKNKGRLLTQYYSNIKELLSWECKANHNFAMTLTHVIKGRWCRNCHLNKIRFKAADKTFQFIESMGGKSITSKEDVYEQCQTKLVRECNVELQCKNNHKWTTSIRSLRSGTWCPNCTYKSEGVCRDIFEEIFNENFPKKRPDWLQKLELDGYCEKLQCAFEYSGKQHYEYIKFFHKEKDLNNFEKQQERDVRKADICKEKGVKLIVVPYQYTYLNKEKMKEYINNKLIENDLIVDIEFID